MPIMNEDISKPPTVMLAEYLLQYSRQHMKHLKEYSIYHFIVKKYVFKHFCYKYGNTSH